MHSNRKWIGLLLILMLTFIAFAGVAYAAPQAPPDPDNDLDGLTLSQEMALGTSDANPDSDGDGLCDGIYDAMFYPGCGNTWGVAGDDGIVGTTDDPGTYYTGEDRNKNGVLDPLGGDGIANTVDDETNPAKKDTDGDGMDDKWEKKYNANGSYAGNNPGISPPGQRGACGVTDPNDFSDQNSDLDPPLGIFTSLGDGLSNLGEYNAGTNPCNPDTDYDFLQDGAEVNAAYRVATNPLKADTDNDGLCDGVENNTGIFLGPHAIGATPAPPALPYPVETKAIVGPGGLVLHPNPTVSVPPVPGIVRACEWQFRTGYFAGSNPTKADSDGDGINDGVEASGASNVWNIQANLGNPVPPTPPGHISDPNKKDTDGDWVEDGLELKYVGAFGWNMDPSQKDTDKDGIPDGYEYSRQSCGFGKMDPTKYDIWDDVDGDGLPSWWEYLGVDGLANTADDGLFADACKVDTDGDGMNDGFEFFYSKAALGNMPGVGPLDPIVDDGAKDADKDGASNYLESVGLGLQAPNKGVDGRFLYPPTGDHTDPSNPKTDADDFIDGFEYWARLDPKVSSACVSNKWFDPKVTVDANGADDDGDGINNSVEYAGPDAKAPATADIVGLIPGDPKGNAWNYADPFYQFQTSGKGADATNPCNPDTDRGGFPDWESGNPMGLNPNYKNDDKGVDHDLDGIPTWTEDANHNGAYDAGESSWIDPDTDKDGLCDGKVQADGWLAGGGKVALFGSYGWHRIYVSGGVWYSDQNDNAAFDSDDPYICGGGEDLDGNGVIAGDTVADRFWSPLGVDSKWGTADDEVWDETNAVNPDTDGDGLCDGSNLNAFGDPGGCGGAEDKNSDTEWDPNIWNKTANETNPLDADSDDDQINDGVERTIGCIDALNVDSDKDGLWDGFKAPSWYVVTFENGLSGGLDLGTGFGAEPWTGYDGADNKIATADDQPGEDVSRNGIVDYDETNACAADTEGDGVPDGVEYKYYEAVPALQTKPWDNSNLLTQDTDIDKDRLGNGQFGRPALDNDSDGDSLCDGPVSSGGCKNKANINQLIGEDLNADGMSPAPETNPMKADSDKDGVWDGIEVTWFERFDCGVPRLSH